jgi:membrane-bound metal-dependent hydrolase YbcI (DUF457 family)
MSLAYLLGKGSSKLLHVKINIPLIMVLSILPDVDIIADNLTGSQLHRGPSHSLIVTVAAFMPFLIIYRKKAIPYFIAFASHSLIGDFFIGGVELLWPFSQVKYGLTAMSVFSPINVLLEMMLFIAAMFVLYRNGDWKVFFSKNQSNLLFIIPLFTVLLPTMIGFPFSAPLILTEPILSTAHMIYLLLFSIAVIKTLASMYKQRFPSSTKPPDTAKNNQPL